MVETFILNGMPLIQYFLPTPEKQISRSHPVREPERCCLKAGINMIVKMLVLFAREVAR